MLKIKKKTLAKFTQNGPKWDSCGVAGDHSCCLSAHTSVIILSTSPQGSIERNYRRFKSGNFKSAALRPSVLSVALHLQHSGLVRTKGTVKVEQ